MATKARLNDEGLLLSGEIDERLPSVTSNLTTHFPFDDTVQSSTGKNIIDYSTWVIGSSGSQTGFTQNGETGCNSIIYDTDPFGNNTAIWRSLNNDVTSDADGGWISLYYATDPTQMYRFSVWIQRRVLGNGTYYFGLYGGGAPVLYRSTGVENTNPYFRVASGTEILGDWFLVVGHVWPAGSGTGDMHVDTGVYTKEGVKLSSATDYVSQAGTTSLRSRSYLYYSTDPTTEQLWVYPRMDLCDGSEPTIQDLITGSNGDGSISNPTTNDNNTITQNGLSVEELTDNIIPLSVNRTFSGGNTHGTFSTGTTYNNNVPYVIGTIDNITDNIVTLVTVDHPLYTYDVVHPTTTGGGLTANTDYFIKRLTTNSFTIHEYNASQDGSQGYVVAGGGFKVHESIWSDTRVSINATSFPTTWAGSAHKSNMGLVKEIIPRGFNFNGQYYDHLRLHTEHRKPEGQTVNYMAYGVLTPVTVGLAYSWSFWARAATPESIGGTIWLNLYTAGSYWTGGGVSMTLTDEWQQYRLEGLIAPATGVTLMYFPSAPAYNTVDIACLQCEQKTFSTSFVDGSRAEGDFQLTNVLNPNKGTVVVDVTFHEDNTVNGLQGADQYCFGNGVDWDTANCFQFHDTDWWYIRDNANTIYNLTMYNEIIRNERVQVALVYDDTDGTMDIYRNGILNTSGAKMTGFIGKLGSLGTNWTHSGVNTLTTYKMCQTIHGLSFYDEPLTSTQIKSLYDGFSISQEGNVIEDGVKERPLTPVDGYFFPFGFDAKDERETFDAYEQTNVVYEDGAVFIGTGTVNEYVYPTFNIAAASGGWLHWGATGSSGSYGQNTAPRYIFNPYQPYSHWITNAIAATGNYLLYQAPAVGDTDRSLQLICCRSDFGVIDESVTFPAWNAASGGIPSGTWTSINHLGNGFYLCKAEGIQQNGTNDLVGVYVKPGYTVYYTQVQLEQTAYSTPFVDGTRGEGSLLLPYEVVDCKTDFTVYGFWKPPVYADGVYRPCITRNIPNADSLYNRILIMGAGTYSSRLACWHGSNGVDESLVYAPTEIPVVAGEWNFFALVRSSTMMYLYIGNSGGFGVGTSVTAYQLDGDETGQYWHIGEYSNHESNAFHRDYCFVQRALSSIEIETIFRTRMRSTDNEINISNQVIEGVTL
jgi:hypothetical protein